MGRREAVLFFCAAFALVSPRFKDYSCTLVLPTTFYLLGRLPSRPWQIATVACASVNLLSLLGIVSKLPSLFGYFNWYTALLVWSGWLVYFLRRKDQIESPLQLLPGS